MRLLLQSILLLFQGDEKIISTNRQHSSSTCTPGCTWSYAARSSTPRNPTRAKDPRLNFRLTRLFNWATTRFVFFFLDVWSRRHFASDVTWAHVCMLRGEHLETLSWCGPYASEGSDCKANVRCRHEPCMSNDAGSLVMHCIASPRMTLHRIHPRDPSTHGIPATASRAEAVYAPGAKRKRGRSIQHSRNGDKNELTRPLRCVVK